VLQLILCVNLKYFYFYSFVKVFVFHESENTV